MTVFYNKTLPIYQLLLVHSLLQFIRTGEFGWYMADIEKSCIFL